MRMKTRKRKTTKTECRVQRLFDFGAILDVVLIAYAKFERHKKAGLAATQRIIWRTEMWAYNRGIPWSHFSGERRVNKLPLSRVS